MERLFWVGTATTGLTALQYLRNVVSYLYNKYHESGSDYSRSLRESKSAAREFSEKYLYPFFIPQNFLGLVCVIVIYLLNQTFLEGHHEVKESHGDGGEHGASSLTDQEKLDACEVNLATHTEFANGLFLTMTGMVVLSGLYVCFNKSRKESSGITQSDQSFENVESPPDPGTKVDNQ